jgi:ABC-type lipoprotein export system ATPase subunit
VAGAVLEISRVSKNYQALRPLRIAALAVAAGERVSIGGIDAAGAELLLNLVTGGALPDEGVVRVFGRSTAEIATGDEWLASLDRFGIVSDRAVLLEEATLEQNLAMPFTLDIEPVPPDVAARVGRLAVECGIEAAAWLARRAADLPPAVRARAHLARAVALEPALLVLEHPTARLPEEARGAFAADIARLAASRRLAALVLTNDDPFARVVAPRNLRLDPATGQLQPLRRKWFG